MSLALLTSYAGEYENFKKSKEDTLLRNLNDVVIIDNRAGTKTPVAAENMNAEEIESATLANNMPHVLMMTPSLVATSENGTGSGYSYLRIRGTDASRINVTLNGVPLNNPESQEAIWVDISDISSALDFVQVQRGVGLSTIGTGSFGGSISMATKKPSYKPSLSSATTLGSYNTFQQNIALSTGNYKGCSLDLRYSNMTSDGYIRNGWLKEQSLFAVFNKRFERSFLRLTYIHGTEHTGITWEGVSQYKMDNDPKYNPAGEINEGAYYDNESDNYYQDHFQGLYSYSINNSLSFNVLLNYTYGYGYYEQYKQGKKFSNMGLPKQIVGGTVYEKTDLIRRMIMDNDYYLSQFSVKYNKENFNMLGGVSCSYYYGDHYGKLLWVEHNENIPDGLKWYDNTGDKYEYTAFVRSEYYINNLVNVYLDLQYRGVNYSLDGIDDDDMLSMKQHRIWDFFNPKFGLRYDINRNMNVYGSVAIGHREPTRSDMKDAIKKGGDKNSVKDEELIDYEIGYNFSSEGKVPVSLGVNFYYMDYYNQLIATGKLSSSGYVLKSNVKDSYRGGIEITASISPLKWIQLKGNITFSRSIAKNYTAYYDTYYNSKDPEWTFVKKTEEQFTEHFDKIKLPFSPEIVSGATVTFLPFKNFAISFANKFVDEQYYSNTQNDELRLPSYDVVNASATYSFKMLGYAKCNLGFHINNLFSKKYASNAWGTEYHFVNGDDTILEKGFYPVAPRNYAVKLTVKL